MSALPSIAVIDDDPDDLFFVTRRITATGCKNSLAVFRDSAEAIRDFEAREAAGSAMPGLVFCDLKMPFFSGFDVLQRFRALPGGKNVPYWMLSGSPLEGDRIRALELGADGYLVKFPDKARFAELISSIRS